MLACCCTFTKTLSKKKKKNLRVQLIVPRMPGIGRSPHFSCSALLFFLGVTRNTSAAHDSATRNGSAPDSEAEQAAQQAEGLAELSSVFFSARWELTHARVGRSVLIPGGTLLSPALGSHCLGSSCLHVYNGQVSREHGHADDAHDTFASTPRIVKRLQECANEATVRLSYTFWPQICPFRDYNYLLFFLFFLEKNNNNFGVG